MTSFFKKLFSRDKKSGASLDIPTEPAARTPTGEPATIPIGDRFVQMPISLADWPAGPQISVGWGQSVGQQRDHNEDAIYALSTIVMNDSTQMPFGMFVVADGMGGHQHGEIASGIAVRAMSSYVIRKLYLPMFGPAPEPPSESLQEIMQGGILEAHKAILKNAPGGGTTLTAVLVLGDQLTITHVGDSRAYLIAAPEGRMEALTRDHSLVKRLEELGQITPEEAAQHPQRNVLYRALGQGEPFEPDIQTMMTPARSYLLICSDGLWGVIPEKEILRLLQSTPDLHLACQRMLDAANKAGGPDNISAILVRLTL